VIKFVKEGDEHYVEATSHVDWDIVEVTVTIIYKELPSQCGEVNEAQSGKVGQEG
jgi:hypothetical protein